MTYAAVYHGAGAATNYEWVTDYGSSISNRNTSSSIEIKVENMGQGGGAVRVRWFFYSDSNGKQLVSKGERDLVLWKNQKEAWVESASATFHDEHYVALQREYTSGGKVSAWLVQFMSAPGKVVKTIGSSGTLESLNP